MTLDFTQEELKQGLEKILSAFGMAQRAGKCSVGTQICVEDMRKEKIKLLAVANNVSFNTRKKLTDTALFHKTQVLHLPCDMNYLSEKLGKTGETSCAGILDEGFVRIIEKLYGQLHTTYGGAN